MQISPNNFDTYAEYRKAVYNETPPTKLEQIKKWLDAENAEITTAEVQELLNTYKAIGQ